MTVLGDHPHTDPGDGRTECDRCGKFVWPVTHSCKGVPVTDAAKARYAAANPARGPRPDGQSWQTCPAATGEHWCQSFPDGAHRCWQQRDNHTRHRCHCGAAWTDQVDA